MKSDNSNVITIKVKPGLKDVFAYKMYDTFFCVKGIFRLLFSALFIALSIWLWQAGSVNPLIALVLFVVGLLNPVVTPMMYLSQAISAADRAIPVIYSFTPEKINAYDGKKRAALNWDMLHKLVWTRKRLLIYTSPRGALILPIAQMSGKETEVLSMIKTAADPEKVTVRKLV